MLILFIFFPTISAALILGALIAVGHPVEFDRFGTLVLGVQLLFLVVAASVIPFTKQNSRLPAWRSTANRWVGYLLAVTTIFYIIAFALIGHYGP